jgi:acetyl esterase/lipase
MDLSYAKHDGTELGGKLYLPSGPGPFPALIGIHGGGWQGGMPDDVACWGAYLAQRGYAFFGIRYRLSKPGQKTYPQAVHDVRAAVQYLRGAAHDLKIAPERIGLLGFSAGAHLAALAALAGDAPLFAGAYAGDSFAKVSTRVKMVAGVYGIYDLLEQHRHDLVARPRDPIVEKFLGVAPMDDRRTYFEASPISYATTANNKTAFLIGYGTEDDIVNSKAQSEEFVLALKQAQFFVRTVIVQGAPHFWGADPIDEPNSFSGFFAPRLVRFMAEKL